MPDKDQRKRDAAKHISLVKGVFAKETEAALAGVKIYEDGDGRDLPVPEPHFEKTETVVTTDFSVAALYAEKADGVIDAGSFSRPGGNYEDGAFGPEQQLCAESNLYPVLCGMQKDYYRANKGYASGQLFNDRAMFVPEVTFMRNGAIRKAGVVVIAAPNRRRALENNRSPQGCDQAIHFRIEAQLRIAAANGVNVLVCGAFGCGALGNDDAQVAGLYKAWLDEHPGVFEKLVFSVPRGSLAAFEAAFPAEKPEVETPAPVEADEEENDEDFRDIELPEGITLR